MESRNLGAQWAVVALAGTLLLLWPAFYNGYPFVYSDTGGYLAGGFDLTPLPDRSMVYGFIIRLASLGVSLWPVVAAQALLLVYLMARTAQAFIDRIRPIGVLGVIAAVALVTPASWYASLVLMDVFTPILMLSAGLFVFGRPAAREKALLAVIAIVSVTTHTSHPIILAPLLAASGAGFFRPRARLQEFQAWSRRLVIVAGLVACGTLGLMATNLAAWGRFTMNPSFHVFLVARLSETPLLKDYLQRTCGEEHWRLCAALPALPYESAQYFLWSPDAISTSIDWREAKPEYDRIIRGILTSPSGLASFAWDCAGRGIRMLGTFRLTAFDPELSDSAATRGVRTFFPREAPAYLSARQFNNRLDIRPGLEWLQWGCVVLAVGWLVRAFALGLGPARTHLAVFLCAGVVINAFVMAGLSAVDGRYQARVAWLVVLLALVARPIGGASASSRTSRS